MSVAVCISVSFDSSMFVTISSVIVVAPIGTLSKSPDPREHRAPSQLITAITVSSVARCLPWAFADGSWLGAENTLAHFEASFVHIEATLVGALQSIHGNRAKLQSICMLPSMCKLLVSLGA